MQRLDDADLGRLGDILAYGRRAMRNLGDCSQAEFAEDEKTFDSVVRCLAVVGEAAWQLTKGAQAQYPDVPWILIAGMRHRLVHDYGEIDTTTAYKAAVEHLPTLLERVEGILADHGEVS